MFQTHKVVLHMILIVLSNHNRFYITCAGKQGLLIKLFDGEYLNDPKAQIHSVENLMKCAHYCLRDAFCKSVNYHATLQSANCHLVTMNRKEVRKSQFRTAAGWSHYEKEDYRMTNCKQALLLNNFQSGFYTIYPTALEMTAYCYMLDGKYTTKIANDWGIETTVNNMEICPSRMPPIKYSGVADIKSLIAMVDQSDSCQQHVKVRCLDAQVYVSKGGSYVLDRDKVCMGARDRNDKHIGYWGGGNAEQYCACAVNGTCYHNAKECNCDSATASLSQTDEGTFTDKNILPITSVAPGDTGGSSETQYYTIGDLLCNKA